MKDRSSPLPRSGANAASSSVYDGYATGNAGSSCPQEAEKTTELEAKTAVLRFIHHRRGFPYATGVSAGACENSKKCVQQRCSALKDTLGWAEEKCYGDALGELIRINDGTAVSSLLQS